MSGAREAVARALCDDGAWCGDCEHQGWDSCENCRGTCRAYAGVALAALRLPAGAP